MTPKARNALEASIVKWEQLAGGKSSYIPTCALCTEFQDNYELEGVSYENGCGGCPVQAHSGESCCIKTPFDAWLAKVHSYADHRDRYLNHPDVVRLAQDELDFLRSLRS